MAAAAAAAASAVQDGNGNLVDLNSKTLGAKMPEITLQDGSKIQTGTVGALLINIKTYNALSTDDHEKKADLEAAFRTALPLLVKVGLFDLFSPEEWSSDAGAGSPGRRYVGNLAKEYFERT